ncbi:MAG TPA: tetratricopeptide repeat protein [Acidobacteriota bacterium]|nr:tetratricopeptide repeat protein [Acidobacteriota bacterium]
MKICPQCHTEQAADTEFCACCGQRLTSGPAPESPDGAPDNLDFVITETHDASHDLVGGVVPKKTDGDLGLETTADLVQREAISGAGIGGGAVGSDTGNCSPIGDSNPTMPAPQETDTGGGTVSDEPPAGSAPSSDSTSQVRKLSDDQIKSIKQNLYGGSTEYLSDEEKLDLLKHIDRRPTDGQAADKPEKPKGFDTAPIVPPKKAGPSKPDTAAPEVKPRPQMAQRTRGVAYYAKNIVQITGEQELHEHDELIINQRQYVLRKKKLNSKLLAAIIAPVAAVAIFAIGTQFTSDITTGDGRIVGVVLDSHERPLLQAVTIRLPALGKSCRTNAQGFFKTDLIEAGSYKIECIVDGEVAATDYATVVDGEISMLTLQPSSESRTKPTVATVRPVPAEAAAESRERAQPQAAPQTGSSPTKSSKPAADRPRAASTAPQTAKIAVNTNVEVPRLSIDGSVVGAGNLTYSRLKPGKHSYSIAADGHRTATGTLELVAGKTTKLDVTLEPMSPAQKEKTYAETDYFHSGERALKANEYETAITDLTEAVRIKPSYAEAYFARAQAYERTGQNPSALDDYIRAAEQYRFKGEYNRAITAYNHCLEMDREAVPALLGRASLYLAKGEEIAAIADYETAIRFDKRNAQAYYGLGEARFNQGYYEKAVKHFKDARSLDPENPLVYQFLMLSYLADDDTNNVRKTYDKYKELASQEELSKLRSDKKFSAVMRVVETQE